MTTQEIKLGGIELVKSLMGVNVSKLGILSDDGEETCVVIDKSQEDLEIARGNKWSCYELVKIIKVLGYEYVILSMEKEWICIKEAKFVFAAADEFDVAV